MRTDMQESQHTLLEKKVKVKVTAKRGTRELVDWTYDADFLDGGGSNNKNKMKFDKGSGPHRITFTLVDETGFGLKFYPDATETMWVAAGASCPTQAGDGGGEILFDRKEVKNELTVVNRNENAGELYYALRFDGLVQQVGKQLYPPYVYDPIMDNGGG